MKLSIALSVLILALGVGLGFRDHQRLQAVREIHRGLVAEASVLGVSTAPAAAEEPRVTKRERQNRELIARDVAAEFVAFGKEMKAHEQAGGGESMQPRIMEMMGLLLSLDASQVKMLIAELRASTELEDEMRQGLIGFSIMSLASDHPQAALAIFTESADLFEGGGMGAQVISSALSRWAKDDPMAALDWVRTNAEKHPNLVTESAKRGLITGAALQDPKLAFSLIGELGLKESSSAVHSILSAAKTFEARSATLVALREYLPGVAEDERRDAAGNAFRTLGDQLAREDFESATLWIEQEKLSGVEIGELAAGLHSITGPATGQWIEWLGEKMPPEKLVDQVSGMVLRWTEHDYLAAGKWLAAAPEGPTKAASVKSYASTIARYEPEVAAQWAMTMPAGKARTETIRAIHTNWPRKTPADEEAAAAFARKHGIK
jgi:hypothetical protein